MVQIKDLSNITTRDVNSAPQKVYYSDYLGVVRYEDALELQQELVRARVDAVLPDEVLLMQHPPVYTIGRFRGEKDVLVPYELLRRKGIDIIHTNRGGSVTYHGPGQLVSYPILNLQEAGIGIRAYIWKLEEVVITLLSTLGIPAHRIAEYPGGVWVDEKKICSIGIHVSRHISMHGLALNVNTDLDYFNHINPCGMTGNVMTSISRIMKQSVHMEAIVETFLDSFSQIFGMTCKRGLYKCPDIIDARNG